MDTILLVKINQVTWERVDLFEDIPITLTIQQQDLTNLTERRVPYSRTFQVPDTSNNAKVFEHYFEVNGTDFNPLQKVNCVVQYRGTDIFQGVLRLNSVSETLNSRTYEIFMLGEVQDFTSYFRNLELQDLSYVDLNHEHDYSSVTTSWECVNDGVSGLFGGKILYPMINYGLDYQGDSSSGASPTFEYSFGQPFSFDQSGFPIVPQAFKPAIQVKTVLDRIFSTTPYTIESEFFDSEYFTSIYMDTFQNGKFGIEYVSGITNQNIFKTGMVQQRFDYDKDTHHILPLFDTNNGYDPLGNYTNFTIPFFTVPYQGNYGFNIRFNLRGEDPCFLTAILRPDIVVEMWKSDSIQDPRQTLIFQSPQITITPGSLFEDVPVNLFINTSLQAGDIVTIFIKDETTYLNLSCVSRGNPYLIKPFSSGGVTDQFIQYDMFESPQIVSDLVDMKLGIPNINCMEFLKSLITMFNLIIIQDENEQIIRIEPYNWYFDDNSRPVKDYTKILDLNSEVKKEPLSFDLSKDVFWTYEKTEFEYLPREFFSRFDFVFGREKFTSDSNILTGVQEYVIPFSPCPTSGVTGGPNFIIPQFFQQTNQQQQPYSTVPHLFFWVGNRLCYLDNFKSVQGSYYLLSGGTPVEWTTYPCVSHLSTLESQFSGVISDLNFDFSFDFFGNTINQIQQYTPFNVYNSFWQTYVDNLYSPQSKRLSGKFWFKPIDVYETSLRDKIWIKDSWYTIEKIQDANLVNRQLTPITLIKEQTPYYKITPPSPIYVYEPNQSYPSPEPLFSTLCYVSTTQTQVCLGTTPTITQVFSFGGPNIENLDQIYYDTGSSFAIFPIGTFIRQTTSTTTFVVVDNYGRVLQTIC